MHSWITHDYICYRGNIDFTFHMGANEVIGANYTVTTPFFKPLLIV